MYQGETLPFSITAACLDIVQLETARVVLFPWVTLSSLKILRLHDDLLRDEGARAFALSAQLTQIKELALASGITDRGAESLCASPNVKHVERLNLQRNQLEEGAIRALVESPYLTQLRALHLGRNPLNEASITRLSEHKLSLSLLDLDRTSLNDRMVQILVDTGALRGIRELNLSNNILGRDACRALARCPDLEVLFLHNCGLHDDDVEALLHNSQLRSLRNLALSENQLTDKSIALLAACEPLKSLHELDVCHNPFSIHEAELALRSSPYIKVNRLCI
jgi:Leucine-rich repeat (LRR) protein